MRITIILIILCVVFFFLPIAFGNYNQIINEFGFSSGEVLSKPWILISSIFLHGSLEHLLSNILVLLFFGAAVESELGAKKMLVIFFLGAFAGDLFSVFFYAPDVISIGASAGIFALMGVGMLVRPFDLSFYPFFLPIPLALLGVLYTVYNAIGFIRGEGNISYTAHFGGLLVGLIFGIYREGWKKSITVILISFGILALVPLLWILLT